MRNKPPAGFNGRRMHKCDVIDNYRMTDRASHMDFGIRDQDTALPNLMPHRHEYFQIHLQLAGITQHFIGSANRPVRPGTLCFIPPFRTHYIPTVTNSKYYILNSGLDYLLPSTEIRVANLNDFSATHIPKLAPFYLQEQIDFVLENENLSMARDIGEAIMHESQNRTTGSTLIIHGYLLQLIGLVWRQYGDIMTRLSAAPAERATYSRTLSKLFSRLRDRIGEPISLTEAAAIAHLSPTSLAHLVKRETGRTFVELMTERRISYAKELLLYTDLSIKEVAFRAGFSDAAYFSRRFRQMEGISPSTRRPVLKNMPRNAIETPTP